MVGENISCAEWWHAVTAPIVDALRLRMADIANGLVSGDQTRNEKAAVMAAIDRLAPIISHSRDERAIYQTLAGLISA